MNALQALIDRAMILDGEVIVETPEGRSDFHGLARELKAKGGSQRLVFYVFDVLYFGGYNLLDVPPLDQKQVLREMLPKGGPIRFSEHLEGDGPTIWRRACELGLAGIVSKRADARYVSERSPNWIKVPCRHETPSMLWDGPKGTERDLTVSISAAGKAMNLSMPGNWSGGTRRTTGEKS